MVLSALVLASLLAPELPPLHCVDQPILLHEALRMIEAASPACLDSQNTILALEDCECPDALLLFSQLGYVAILSEYHTRPDACSLLKEAGGSYRYVLFLSGVVSLDTVYMVQAEARGLSSTCLYYLVRDAGVVRSQWQLINADDRCEAYPRCPLP